MMVNQTSFNDLEILLTQGYQSSKNQNHMLIKNNLKKFIILEFQLALMNVLENQNYLRVLYLITFSKKQAYVRILEVTSNMMVFLMTFQDLLNYYFMEEYLILNQKQQQYVKMITITQICQMKERTNTTYSILQILSINIAKRFLIGLILI